MNKSKDQARKKLVVLSALFLLLSGTSAFAEMSLTKRVPVKGGELEYRISMEKSTYLLYEPIRSELWIKNLSSNIVPMYPHPEEQLWTIRDQNGKTYSSRGLIVDYLPSTIEVKPGDSLGGDPGLNLYGINMPRDTAPGALYPFRYFPVGEYSVYYGQLGPLQFRVIAPEGNEAVALKLYLDSFSPVWNERFPHLNEEEQVELWKENVKRLQAMADRYPKSAYAIDALSSAVSIAWMNVNDGKLAYQINARLMREYPDSRYNGIEFLRTVYYRKNPDRFRAVVDSIIQNSTSPNVIAKAKAALKKLEGEK